MKKEIKITERGWPGHYICAAECLFRRNTLVSCEEINIVVSTVGMYVLNDKVMPIGINRYYETMVFHSKKEDKKYHDADVSKQIYFDSPWRIVKPYNDLAANKMHNTVVSEIKQKIQKEELC